jgi:hypothetical protein
LQSIQRMVAGAHDPALRRLAMGAGTPSLLSCQAMRLSPQPSQRRVKIRRTTSASRSSTVATVKERPPSVSRCCR